MKKLVVQRKPFGMRKKGQPEKKIDGCDNQTVDIKSRTCNAVSTYWENVAINGIHEKL